ncbi:hypothetical protein GCM10007392_46590 [Saccharospirillum salsuginis]|uniref:Uncharacterized protein n=1 Tax=Saccharospirillum salsuginis TaxID=418750 RepID=A0A918NK04_9GAMM|nr:hypothetical protein GCM10007392_46590 [Saccharospirillum salsuginis]
MRKDVKQSHFHLSDELKFAGTFWYVQMESVNTAVHKVLLWQMVVCTWKLTTSFHCMIMGQIL